MSGRERRRSSHCYAGYLSAHVSACSPGPSGFGAAAKDSVSFTYNAEASTEDRSWHAGCNSEVKLAHRAHGDRPAP